MDLDFEVYEANDDHALGRWRGATLYVWRRQTSLAALELMRRKALAMVADAAAPAVLLGGVEAFTPAPDSRTRQALSELMTTYPGDVVHASALVFDGPGLRGAGVRAVATGIALLASLPYPHHVYGSVDDAAAFLSGTLKEKRLPAYDPAELAAAFRKLRAS